MSRRAIVAVALAALTVAGCGTTPEALPRRHGPVGSDVLPQGVQIPAEIPAATPVPPCQPRESYRATGPLPAPGALPAESTMAKIKEHGRLIVGIGPSAYKLAFRNPYTQKVEGFEAEIAREIAFAIFGGNREDPGLIEFRTMNTDERIPALKDGVVDLVIAAMTMTCERWQDIAFSAEYYAGGQMVLVNKNAPFNGIEDLGGKRVCASRSSTNIRTIAGAASHPIPVAAANTSDCLLLLQQGVVDAVSTGDEILAPLAAQDPGTKIVGQRFTDEPTAIGVSKSSIDLVRFVNAVLERSIATGKWSEWQRAWLPSNPPTPPVPRYKPE